MIITQGTRRPRLPIQKKERKRGGGEERRELLMINVLLRTLTRSAENIRVKQSTMAEQKRHM